MLGESHLLTLSGGVTNDEGCQRDGSRRRGTVAAGGAGGGLLLCEQES